jgi:hypothetical protein
MTIDPKTLQEIITFMERATRLLKEHGDYGVMDEIDDLNLLDRIKGLSQDDH